MDIYSQLGLLYTNVLTEIIFTVSGFSFDVLDQEQDTEFEDMVGIMSLNGKKNGMLFLSAKEADIRELCSYMIGVNRSEVTNADIEDALRELVNMVAGSAKLRLSSSDYIFNLSPPFVIKGKNISLATKDRMHIISRVLGNGELSVKLKVIY